MECLIVLILNAQRKIKGHYLVSVGSVDTCIAHPREIFRTAIVASASSILLMHNHPSGCADPSTADMKVTLKIVEAGKLLDIRLEDHIIVGKEEYKSFREVGYIEEMTPQYNKYF